MARADHLSTLTVDRSIRANQRMTGIPALLLAGWALATIGYYGPWIAHATSALTLSGGDMGEFVKFLPSGLNGSLSAVRQLFYLPPMAVVLSIALLVGSERLGYAAFLRALLLLLAIPVSLQLLPPAWSVAGLLTSEFRAQGVALGILWLFLAAFWLWSRVPLWLAGSVCALLSLAALGMATVQFLLVKPAIDQVYGAPPNAGWGFFLCMAGLGIMAVVGVQLAVRGLPPKWSGDVWSAE